MLSLAVDKVAHDAVNIFTEKIMILKNVVDSLRDATQS
jgi:hypothetical protein